MSHCDVTKGQVPELWLLADTFLKAEEAKASLGSLLTEQRCTLLSGNTGKVNFSYYGTFNINIQ